MKNLLLFFTFCIISTSSFSQGMSCTDATEITSDGDYNGDLTGITTQYWYINPDTDADIDIIISSASDCGIVVDIKEFSSSQTDACVPIGPGDNGRIVSNWNSCGGNSTGSSITLSVTSNQFYYLKISRFFIGSGEPYTIGISGNMSLPISLLDQAIDLKGQTAILEWTTSRELNNNHFNIERSTDGRIFQVIGKVNGNLTTPTSSTYQFNDNKPFKENYYRIVQYDLNGNFEIFPVLYLNLEKYPEKDLQVYFQSDQLLLSYNANVDSAIPFYLVNAMGQVVYRQKLSLQKGNNEILINELSTLLVGVYFGILESENGLLQTRLFKSK